MKKIFALTLSSALMLAACSSTLPPVLTPKPILVLPSSCEVLRITLEDGGYSPAFGGGAGIFVPAQGLSLAIPLEQLECRENGVFVALKR